MSITKSPIEVRAEIERLDQRWQALYLSLDTSNEKSAIFDELHEIETAIGTLFWVIGDCPAPLSGDYKAVTGEDGGILCRDCLEASSRAGHFTPIFEDSEWDYYPTCSDCGTTIDFVNLTEDGWKNLTQPARQAGYFQAKGNEPGLDGYGLANLADAWLKKQVSDKDDATYEEFHQAYKEGYRQGEEEVRAYRAGQDAGRLWRLQAGHPIGFDTVCKAAIGFGRKQYGENGAEAYEAYVGFTSGSTEVGAIFLAGERLRARVNACWKVQGKLREEQLKATKLADSLASQEEEAGCLCNPELERMSGYEEAANIAADLLYQALNTEV